MLWSATGCSQVAMSCANGNSHHEALLQIVWECQFAVGRSGHGQVAMSCATCNAPTVLLLQLCVRLVTAIVSNTVCGHVPLSYALCKRCTTLAAYSVCYVGSFLIECLSQFQLITMQCTQPVLDMACRPVRLQQWQCSEPH